MTSIPAKPDEGKLRCFNPKCGSSNIVVGYDGQPALCLYGRCTDCGCQGPRVPYDTTPITVDLSLFSAIEPARTAQCAEVATVNGLLEEARTSLKFFATEPERSKVHMYEQSEAHYLIDRITAALAGRKLP